jgi:hypothetical protein
MFQVVPDGRLVAYSADKGEKLLDVQTGLWGGMGPPLTYQLDGKQYDSLMGGQGTVVARNAEAAAGHAAAAAETTNFRHRQEGHVAHTRAVNVGQVANLRPIANRPVRKRRNQYE